MTFLFCLSNYKYSEKIRNFRKFLHFNLLRSSYPTVPLYADGYELLASGAFLTSVSVPKNKFFDTLDRPRFPGAVFYVCSPGKSPFFF